ncbi:MAG: 50S ribosomal protein L17 [Candidatus Cloacimonetes bacterium]|nr:50S ribosomal protein L17 [Candidatus Cloacimonadota bacterium]
MKKRVYGKKLSRSPAHRKALTRNLIQALFEYGKIQTTLPKAKVIRPIAEKLVTRARKKTPHAFNQLEKFFYKRKVAKKLFEEIAPKYKNRPGGYTRIVKLGRRGGGAAEMAVIELVEEKKDNVETKKKRA